MNTPILPKCLHSSSKRSQPSSTQVNIIIFLFDSEMKRDTFSSGLSFFSSKQMCDIKNFDDDFEHLNRPQNIT